MIVDMKVKFSRSDIQLALASWLSSQKGITIDTPGDIKFRTVESSYNKYITEVEAYYEG